MKDRIEFPGDVEMIIEYTKYRKKYPQRDMELRLERRMPIHGKGSIKAEQAAKLLYIMKDEEKRGELK